MMYRTLTRVALIGMMMVFSATAAQAAKECRIKYGWNTGNSLQGTFKNKSKTIYLNKGQTKTINKKRMNYVMNLKSRKVKFYLKSAADVTLGKNQKNPAFGKYLQSVKLKKVKCIGGSASGGGSSSTGVPALKKCTVVKTRRTPAPPAPGGVPIPYPNLNCR
jgi:hypothetical protein